MPDFAIRTEIITKDTARPVFMKAGRAAGGFATAVEKAMAKASRADAQFIEKFLSNRKRIEKRAKDVRGVTFGILGADVIREGFRRAAGEVGSFVTEAAKIERATTEFGTFVRSVELGKEIVADLRALGARTPFEFEDFTLASKILLALRATTQGQLIPTLTMLGDASSGSADKLSRIAFAFAEVKSNSKASFQEIRQFTNAGVPMLATLADMWGVSMSQARKMVTQGKATGDAVSKAFKIMTSEGGIFFKGMEKTSKDFFGRMSTLRDEIKIFKADVGLGLLPTLKEYVNEGIRIAKMASQWAKANQGLIKREVIEWLETGKQLLKDTAPIIKTVLGIVTELLPIVRELSPLLPIMAAGWFLNKMAMSGLIALNAARAIGAIVPVIWAATFGTLAWDAAILLIPGGIAAMVALTIAGIALMVGGIVLLVKKWEFVRDVMVNIAKKVISAWATIFFSPFLLMIKGIGEAGRWLGRTFKIKGVEREFGKLSDMMDELNNKIIGFGFGKEKIIELSFAEKRPLPRQPAAFPFPGTDEFFAQMFRDLPTPKPQTPLEKLTQKLPDSSPFSMTTIINNLLTKTQNELVKEKLPGFKEERQRRENRQETETPFMIPAGVIESFSLGKQVIEHVVKLIPPGGNSDSAVTLSPGSEAPPIEIDILGLN